MSSGRKTRRNASGAPPTGATPPCFYSPPARASSSTDPASTTDLLSERIAWWQHVLRLDHWNVVVERAAAEDGKDATVWTHGDYDEAKMWFHPDWREFDRERLERVIVHELLHIHLRDIEKLAELHGIPEGTWRHHEEGLVERLARAYVRAAGIVPE